MELNGKVVPIDVKISKLIGDLWRRGIETTYCCQGSEIGLIPGYVTYGPSPAYISFKRFERRPEFYQKYQSRVFGTLYVFNKGKWYFR